MGIHMAVQEASASTSKRSLKLWKLLLWLAAALIALVAISIVILISSPAARDWTATQVLTNTLIIRERLGSIPIRSRAQPVRLVGLRTHDGVRLSTQIFLPEGKGPWPVIVVRDPYSFSQYVTCKVFVRYDYACVYQEVRGRGKSGGIWYPFTHEREDGRELIQWILRQHWQNGRLALVGGSYLGVAVWAVAGDLPPQVRTFVPTVAHGDIYHLAYHNGMFNEGVGGVWLYTQFQPFPRILWASRSWRNEVARHFPALGADPKPFGAAWASYRDYISHPDRDDPYWQSQAYLALRDAHKRVRVPVLMIDYANDFFLPGALQTYAELPTRAQSVLVIGPGNHGGQPGPVIKDAYTGDYADTLAWLDHYLRGAPLPERLRPGVDVFVHGENSWRHFDQWPRPSRSLIYSLGNMAGARKCDGGTLTSQPATLNQVARYTYDPRHPVQTRGGAFELISDGVVEQHHDICERPDVLSFASAPIAHDTLLNGAIRARLSVSSDAGDTAFTVKLSEHFADGRVYNIRDDISTLSMRNGASHRMAYTPGDQVEVVFDLTPIMWRLKKGSRLRLDVSSSDVPAFFPHPNRAGLWSSVANPIAAHQSVFGGSLELPVQ